MCFAGMVRAEGLRIVTYAAPFSRAGPGLLLRDLLAGDDPQLEAALDHLRILSADVIVLTSFDFDHDLLALREVARQLARDGPGPGADYQHIFSILPNAGMATGLDLDGNGRRGEARDAQGYGRFAGEGGLAVLSRWPVDLVADYSVAVWAELPFATLPTWPDGRPFPSAEVRAVQRLSSTGHWHLAVAHPAGRFDLLVWSATPPAFDGPEGLNILRNQDETLFWPALWATWQGEVAPFVLVGNANLDPVDGGGRHQAMAGLLAHPLLQDPGPRQTAVPLPRLPHQTGPPALANAHWEGIGALRVSYILPSAGWELRGAGLRVTRVDDPAGPHYPVWVDLGPPPAPLVLP